MSVYQYTPLDRMASATENPLTVMTRESMRGLRANTVEETRVRQINHIIKIIHSATIYHAKTTSETSYQCVVQEIHNGMGLSYGEKPLAFDTKDKADILWGLEKLFPHCPIDYKNLLRNPMDGNLIRNPMDGRVIDISMVNSQVLERINNSTPREYIVIDWT